MRPAPETITPGALSPVDMFPGALPASGPGAMAASETGALATEAETGITMGPESCTQELAVCEGSTTWLRPDSQAHDPSEVLGSGALPATALAKPAMSPGDWSEEVAPVTETCVQAK